MRPEPVEGRAVGAGRWLPPLVLTLLTLAVFAQTSAFGFVNLDDDHYVYENRHVLAGLGRAGLAWAFGGFHVWNYHPLTWLSHMADVSLFGPSPGPMHAVNVGLHLAAALLLFAFLRAATGATVRSAAVAALFAIHPLHVESVAWISERKDVLSTALGFAALLAWVPWARRRSRPAYAAALALFALSLLAKPMLVTLPALLLVLDAWPLGRLPLGSGREAAQALPRLVPEKLPFLALSAASSALTVAAQASGGGADSAVAHLPFGLRLANAVASVGAYLGQTFWPAGLSAFYPHPASSGGPALAAVTGGAAALLVLSALAFGERVRRPWLAAGWCWFLGTLVPVIGLVQVGSQARADRYTYVPLVGVFVVAVWAAGELASRSQAARQAVVVSAIAAVLALAWVAHRQVGAWQDGETLHRHALAVDGKNWKAWQGLCAAELDAGGLDEAARHCEEALRLLPTFHDAWNTLGVVRARQGNHAGALRHFERALELRPGWYLALRNAGAALGNLGRPAEAAQRLAEAVAARPDEPDAWAMLATACADSGDLANARAALARLETIDPERAARVRARRVF
ncbi:MAG: tetratricopeptide repeat protein [Anaeromyxobacter sp.]